MEKDFWQRYRDRGLAVFGINTSEEGDAAAKARGFVQAHGVTYPTLMDTQDTTAQAYQVSALPTIAVIDRKGVLRYLQAGFDEEGVKKLVEELLAEAP